ncbi:hypothetical protein F5146DRAFT_999661 [Armillaria mellea]|nr:hypothetical protein F5146DRAFT_999661 [Armillaria mellea]
MLRSLLPHTTEKGRDAYRTSIWIVMGLSLRYNNVSALLTALAEYAEIRQSSSGPWDVETSTKSCILPSLTSWPSGSAIGVLGSPISYPHGSDLQKKRAVLKFEPPMHTLSSFCDSDGYFGPQSACRSFDFTVVFQNSILAILPSSWIHVITGLLSLIGWAASTPASLPKNAQNIVTVALVLSFIVSAIQLILASHIAQKRTLRFFISLFLLLTLVWILPVFEHFTSQFFLGAFVAQFASRFLSLCSFNTKSELPEDASFFSHVFVLWVFPIMWRGRLGDMTMEDLPELQHDMASDQLYKRFDHFWSKEKEDRSSSASLLRAILYAFYPTLLASVPPAIIRSLAQAVQPVLVNAVLHFMESYSTPNPEPGRWGWALVGSFAIVFLGFAAGTSQYFYYIYRSGAYIRGTMIEAIYRKSLNLASDTGVDLERITLAIDPLHQLWSSLIVIGIGLYILYTQLGVSFVAAVIVTAVIMILTPMLSRRIDDLQDAWSTRTDARISLIAGIFHQITAIKLSAYEPELIDKVLATSKQRAFVHEAILEGFCSRVHTQSWTIFPDLHPGHWIQLDKITGPVLAAYNSVKRLETYLLSAETSLECRDEEQGEQAEQLNQDGVVTMYNVRLGWKDKVVLSEVNISIKSQTSNMVVGRVATGKSTLLASLLGEATVLEGSVSRSREKCVAYCSQAPWLQTGHSIEENITFSSPMDPPWYQAVINACALDVDLASTPGGDSSLAKGLSGGQKARITHFLQALARAGQENFAFLICVLAVHLRSLAFLQLSFAFISKCL